MARIGERRCEYRVLVGKPEGNHLEDLAVQERIILKYTLKGIRCEEADWIGLAQDMGNFRALVDAVMNLRVP